MPQKHGNPEDRRNVFALHSQRQISPQPEDLMKPQLLSKIRNSVFLCFCGKAGFTIIETTIVLAIIALLATIVLPRASGFLDAIRVRGAVTEIESLFSTARHVAIARGAQSSLEIDPAEGVILVRVGPDTLEKRELQESEGVTLRATRTIVTYSPTGVGYGAANLTLIVERNRSADTIYVSRLGRVRH